MTAAAAGTDRERCLQSLQRRFAEHPHRHAGIAWHDVAARVAHGDALAVLQRMEASGGEPDVVGRDDATGGYVFCDCAAESPVGRRSLCYDAAARLARKANAPSSSAVEMAAQIGIQLLDEAQYRRLQQLDAFDRKTLSWIVTPPAIRALGGALFGDRRYDTVFTYHNGADSYYAARGFRGRVVV